MEDLMIQILVQDSQGLSIAALARVFFFIRLRYTQRSWNATVARSRMCISTPELGLDGWARLLIAVAVIVTLLTHVSSYMQLRRGSRARVIIVAISTH